MLHKWWFQQMGVPQNGWCIIVYHGKSECNMDDSGLALYVRTPQITNYTLHPVLHPKKNAAIFQVFSRPRAPFSAPDRGLWCLAREACGGAFDGLGATWGRGADWYGLMVWLYGGYYGDTWGYLGLLGDFFMIFGWFWMILSWFLDNFWMILDDFWMIFGWFWMIFGWFLDDFWMICWMICWMIFGFDTHQKMVGENHRIQAFDGDRLVELPMNSPMVRREPRSRSPSHGINLLRYLIFRQTHLDPM